MDPLTNKDTAPHPAIPCGYVCTYAVTGSHHPAHQPIYTCHTCHLSSASGYASCSPIDEFMREDADTSACICECCAEICHDQHEVSFVGVGPCTCDCFRLCATTQSTSCSDNTCQLQEVSREEAARLGFCEGGLERPLNDPIPLKIPPVSTLLSMNEEEDDMDDEEYDISAHAEDKVEEWTSPICIECNSSMGGYTTDAFTIPYLSAFSHDSCDGVKRCQSLIRQAEALVENSHDTFWMPIDNDDGDLSPSTDWSDLEILAKKIFQRHVTAYNLQSSHVSSGKSVEDDDSSKPGAEWWVQVKPAGSYLAPVDLHYDKDEALAEAFSLGSFPTLSTVTYLTGDANDEGKNVAPTVVFPHTYHDDEDRPISAMLLSHPVRGKHIVFDGRLLHGAPGHRALRRDATDNNGEDDSSLRVTFLVNIWRTGRPAGVHVLPQSIRTKIQSAAFEASTSKDQLPKLFPLDFKKSNVPHYFAPSKLSLAFSADNPMDHQIILPFVSKGATWISDDDSDDKNYAKDASSEADDKIYDGQEGCIALYDIDDDVGEDDEDELFLQLPQFATPEYIQNGADTAIFLFRGGNEARLMRRGVGGKVDSGAF
ncbi:hypothetical protein HJC23_006628 [Cyclotella cryptica]|uniref:Uncharacterized protein n=1 Tax=Cyclotella cryptica TaxID=29204 RepID=A0ABD3QYL5_9STRA|eukprot:CCRYP_001047-RA/>CCRYP_001047-RA protein AED:0.17 eAED:0.17 QI:0/-1/0/1/-1/1/1/0/595